VFNEIIDAKTATLARGTRARATADGSASLRAIEGRFDACLRDEIARRRALSRIASNACHEMIDGRRRAAGGKIARMRRSCGRRWVGLAAFACVIACNRAPESDDEARAAAPEATAEEVAPAEAIEPEPPAEPVAGIRVVEPGRAPTELRYVAGVGTKR